jgi:hypothetical protein
MKIKVCTMAFNNWYKEIVKYGIQTIKNYCSKNNYKFIIDNEDIDTVYDKSRDPPWFKIKVIEKNLNECDYLVWIDADTHVMNPNKKIEYLIERYLENKSILIAREGRSDSINTGVMIWRNSDYTKSILNEVWNNKENFDQSFHEQASLHNLYDRNINNLQSEMVVIPGHLQYELFSYWFMYHPDTCFIIHAARCAHDREGFIYTMDIFCPLKMIEESDQQYTTRIAWLKNAERCRKDIEEHTTGGGKLPSISARNNPSYKVWGH